jgi:hypothetical protein
LKKREEELTTLLVDTRRPTSEMTWATLMSNDLQVADQLILVNEGESSPRLMTGFCTDVTPEAAQAAPLGSTSGSMLRMDPSDCNVGKAEWGVNFPLGAGPSSDLLTMTAQYRYYLQDLPTSRSPAVGFRVTDSTTNPLLPVTYRFVFQVTSLVPNTWHTVSVDGATATNFRLFFNGAPGNAVGQEKSLADWALDATWGFVLQPPYQISRFDINLGSFQRNALLYLDYMQASFLDSNIRTTFETQCSIIVE